MCNIEGVEASNVPRGTFETTGQTAHCIALNPADNTPITAVSASVAGVVPVTVNATDAASYPPFTHKPHRD